MMKFLRTRFPAIVSLMYLLAVGVCLFFGFDFEGSIEVGWVMALIVLTLPWSVVSIILAWALIHGAGLETFAAMYLFFAAINATFIYWCCSKFQTRIAASE